MNFQRYAIYYTAPAGALSDFGARWLGWDIEAGATVAHLAVDGLPEKVEDLTETPRKYGFHGTIKPPFRLADGTTADELAQETAHLAARLSPVELPGLELSRLCAFLALTPVGDMAALQDLAASAVSDLDRFRRAPGEDELARRRKARLSERQEENLTRWGYPYVMEDFRFHLTLTGRLARGQAEQVQAALAPALKPVLQGPFTIDALTLVGEDAEGRFHGIERFGLAG